MTVLIRPEQIDLRPADGQAGLTGTIVRSGYRGHDTVLHVQLASEHDNQTLIVRTPGNLRLPPGTSVTLSANSPILVWPRPSSGEERPSIRASQSTAISKPA